MDCASVENILDLYIDKRLTPRRMRGVEAHLQGCPVCLKLYGEQSSLRLSRTAVEAAPADLLKALEDLA